MRKVFTVCAMACLMLVGLSPAFGQSNKALSSGKVFVWGNKIKGSDTPQAVVKAVVDAPPSKVWKVLEDCNKYKYRMSRVEESKLIKKKGNAFWCKVRIGLPFPLSDLTATTKAVHTIKKDQLYKRSWSLIKGDYKFNNGSWTLTPFGKSGKRTLVVYRVHAEPTTSIPDWVRERAQKSSLPGMIERLRKEVRKIK